MSQEFDSYRENGFVVVKGFFPENEVRAVLEGAERVFHLKLQSLAPQAFAPTDDFFTKMQKLLSLDVQAYLASARTVAKLHSTQSFCTSSRTAQFLQEKLGLTVPSISAEPVFHINSEKLRIPNGYYGFEAHQDWTSIQGSLDTVVSWIPLTNVSATNFPMLVIPGSHRRGLLPGTIEKNAFKVRDDLIHEKDYVPVVVNAGDLVIMSAWTVHKTGVDGCSGFRLSVSNRWENVAEPTFVARNFPCAYVKSVRRDFITPDFPSQQQVERVFERRPDLA